MNVLGSLLTNCGLLMVTFQLSLIPSKMKSEKVYYLSDMCINGRFLTNKYTGQQFWCKCGHCPACLQEKAAVRSQRIRNEYDGKSQVYFGTLTYDRISCPHFKYDDYLKIRDVGFGELPVYRNYSIHWSVNKQKFIRKWSPHVLTSIPVETNSFDGKWMPFLRKQKGCVGVIHFKDFQDFAKRFRINLNRLGYDEKIKLFDVAEYGGRSLRPHFHFLLYSRNIPYEAFYDALVKAWPYGVRVRMPESFQLVTDDPAGYVSSYVNSGENLPLFLARYFKSKHSASKYFGHGVPAFSLEEIQKKVSTGTLNYVFRRVTKHGEKIYDFPIPKYVINRFFPLFKGHSRLASDTVFDFLSSGFRLDILRKAQLRHDQNCPKFKIDYDTNHFDLTRIQTRFINAYFTYKKFFPEKNLIDYAIDYQNTWSCWRNTCYKYFRTDDTIPDFYKFDNMCLRSDKEQKAWFLASCSPDQPFIVSNNEKPPVVSQTDKMTKYYYKYCKQKEVTGACLYAVGVDV